MSEQCQACKTVHERRDFGACVAELVKQRDEAVAYTNEYIRQAKDAFYMVQKAESDRDKWFAERCNAQAERDVLKNAIADHHRQKADDRCIEDDDRLYAAAGLPPCERRVGDKTEMLLNCARFIERRCEGGHWPSYAELEKEIERFKSQEMLLVELFRSPAFAIEGQRGDDLNATPCETAVRVLKELRSK